MGRIASRGRDIPKAEPSSESRAWQSLQQLPSVRKDVTRHHRQLGHYMPTLGPRQEEGTEREYRKKDDKVSSSKRYSTSSSFTSSSSFTPCVFSFFFPSPYLSFHAIPSSPLSFLILPPSLFCICVTDLIPPGASQRAPVQKLIKV